MEKFTSENLILLEFLVDQVNLDYNVQQEFKRMTAETCVCFQFLDNAPLCVCEEDFAPKKKSMVGAPNDGNLKNGKSCLFSLTPEQAETATKQFDIYVEVIKKFQPGVLPEKMVIGESLISIVNLFNELVESIAGSGESPVAKTLKDCFKITNPSGELVGHISVYIRMSCFGKLIVTQFQMNLEDKSCQFKGKEGHFLFKYNKNGKHGDRNNGNSGRNHHCPEEPCDNGQMGNYAQPQQLGSVPTCALMQQQQPMQQQMYVGGGGGGGMTAPCNECGPPPNNTPAASVEDPNSCYQEIGACMGGNALTIRVHKDKNKAEMVDGGDGCFCNPTSKGDATTTTNVNGPISGPVQTQEYAMRPGADPNSPISFKLAGNCTGGNGGNVVVNSPMCTAPDGTKYTEISDPNRDVFILRIGKKSEGVDKKSNLELELCTPKGPELKPIPKKETRDTQYEESDCGPPAGDKGKGGKGKGKGGKGGKGKKGKKK